MFKLFVLTLYIGNNGNCCHSLVVDFPSREAADIAFNQLKHGSNAPRAVVKLYETERRA